MRDCLVRACLHACMLLRLCLTRRWLPEEKLRVCACRIADWRLYLTESFWGTARELLPESGLPAGILSEGCACHGAWG